MIRFLDSGSGERLSLEELANAVGSSDGQFRALFRRWAATTPEVFLELLTVESARRRLEESRAVLWPGDGSSGVVSGSGRGAVIRTETVRPGGGRVRGGDLRISYGLTSTPFGTALVGQTDGAVCHLSFLGTGSPSGAGAVGGASEEALRREWPAADLERDDGLARDLVSRIASGSRPPLHVAGTEFQVRVWEALLGVPEGRVTCYVDLARAAGRPGATRAVAGAVARNRLAWVVPCHRVIRKQGEPGGYRWGPERKRALLGWEAARLR